MCIFLLAPGDQLLSVSVIRVHDRCFKGISEDVLVLESSQFGFRCTSDITSKCSICFKAEVGTLHHPSLAEPVYRLFKIFSVNSLSSIITAHPCFKGTNETLYT